MAEKDEYVDIRDVAKQIHKEHNPSVWDRIRTTGGRGIEYARKEAPIVGGYIKRGAVGTSRAIASVPGKVLTAEERALNAEIAMETKIMELERKIEGKAHQATDEEKKLLKRYADTRKKFKKTMLGRFLLGKEHKHRKHLRKVV